MYYHFIKYFYCVCASVRDLMVLVVMVMFIKSDLHNKPFNYSLIFLSSNSSSFRDKCSDSMHTMVSKPLDAMDVLDRIVVWQYLIKSSHHFYQLQVFSPFLHFAIVIFLFEFFELLLSDYNSLHKTFLLFSIFSHKLNDLFIYNNILRDVK